jgi:hypothetical protein
MHQKHIFKYLIFQENINKVKIVKNYKMDVRTTEMHRKHLFFAYLFWVF